MRSTLFHSGLIKGFGDIKTLEDIKTLRGIIKCFACNGAGIAKTRLRCCSCGGRGFVRS